MAYGSNGSKYGGTINYGVKFEVDTAGLKKVQSALSQIQNSTTKDLVGKNLGKNLDAELDQVKKSAGELQGALQKAFNQNLGTINITRFNEELKKLNLNKIQSDMAKLGSNGVNAFRNVASQILTTNNQLVKSQTLLEKMGTTFLNTVKWNIASSVMNSFTGSIQEAFGYVKSLDTALNNIQIVTQASSEKMANFAVQANNAAQALGKTTNEYTQASLIFYQQGLDDTQVAERTDVTLKMANVTKDSAEEVSSYMTAIWNNFDDGSQSLEHYADVITNLGAHTASSSAEIAQGLSKFAAVADTVGLSYEYATTALATLVATTRQAPEVVGTALKTLFARIQDLELGDTLEDGTTLGKYSEALAKVGINIKDANGEVKNMNQILDEMGAKWETLSKDTQIALAQTVAGTRQYTQLVALMDNWDTFGKNLEYAADSAGTLQNQQDTYMDSLAAHLNQLQAAKEGVIDSLVNADSFKGFVDAGTGVLNFFENFIDSIGGGGTAIANFASILGRVFSKQIGTEIGGWVNNLRQAKQAAVEAQAQMEVLTQFGRVSPDMQASSGDINSATQLAINNTKELIADKQKISEINDGLTRSEQEQANALIAQKNELMNQQEEWEKNKEKATEYLKNLKISDPKSLEAQGIESLNRRNKQGQETYVNENEQENLRATISLVENLQEKMGKATEETESFYSSMSKAIQTLNTAPAGSSQFENAWNDILDNSVKATNALEQYQDQWGMSDESFNAARQAINDMFDNISGGKMVSASENLEAFKNILDKEIVNASGDAKQALETLKNSFNNFGAKNADSLSNASRIINEIAQKGQVNVISQQAVKAASSIGQLAAGISALKNLGSIWNNKDLSTGEKVLQTFTNLGMVVGQLASGFTGLMGATQKISIALDLAKTKSIADAAAKTGETIATEEATGAQWSLNAAMEANPIGAFILAIAALTAALVAFAKLADFAFVNAQERLENANKALESSQTAADNAKSAYDDLKSSLENYNEGIDAFSELTRGTDEFNDALRESNAQVLDLINKFPELAQYIERTSEGLLTISKEGQNAVTELYSNRMDTANQQLYLAQNNQRNASDDVSLEELGKSFQYIAGEQGGASVNQMGAEQTRQIIDLYNSQKDIFDEALKGNITPLTEALSNITPYASQIVDSVVDNISAIESMSVQLEETAEVNKISNMELADAFLSTSDKVSDTYNKMTDSQRQLMAGLVSQNGGTDSEIYQQKLRENEDKLFGRTDEDIQKEYAELMGYDYSKNLSGNVADYYKDGVKVLESFNDAQARAYIAQRQAWEEIIGDAKEFEQIVSDVTALEDKIGQRGVLGSMLGGNDADFSQLTQKQVDAFKEELKNADLEKDFGITDEAAKAMGFESAEAYAQGLFNGLDNYTKNNEQIFNNLLPSAKKAFNGIKKDLSDLGQDTQSNVAHYIEQGVAKGGSEGAEKVANLLEQINPKQLDDTIEILQNTDWGSASVESVIEKLNDAGIATAGFEGPLSEVISLMRSAEGLTWEGASEQYNKVNDIQEKVFSGESITTEDYDYLQGLGLDVNEFFDRALDGTVTLKKGVADFIQESSDGTLLLKGSAKELYDFFENEGVQGFQDLKAAEEERLNRLQSIEGMRFNDVKSSVEQGAETGSSYGSTMDTQALNYLSGFGAIQNDEYNTLSDTLANGNEEQKIEAYQRISELLTQIDNQTGEIKTKEKEIQENIDEISTGLEKERDLQEDIKTARSSLDENVDEEKWENLTDYLQEYADELDDVDDELKDHREAAEELSEELLRFNNAAKEAIDKSDEWAEALASGSVADQAEAISELDNAYSDMLDLDYGTLSNDFLTNAHNLDLMTQAANGSEEAYNELQQAALQDILATVGLNTEDFQAKFPELQNAINNGLDDIEIGAYVNDADAIQAMNELINSADMTAKQASDLLASMGVDATVEEQQVPETQEQAFINAIPHIDYEYADTVKVADGEEIDAGRVPVPRITYDAEPETASNTGTKMVSALRVTSARKSSGGGFKINQSGGGGRGGGGGGGGKGGGGKGSTKKPKTEKIKKAPKTKRADPYHDVNKTLQKITDTYDRASKKQDKLIGKKAQDNIKKQNELLKEQNEVLNKKLEINGKEQAYYKQQLIGFNVGIDGKSFNKDGTLKDGVYEKAIESMNKKVQNAYAAYNDWITNVYNKMTADEQEDAATVTKKEDLEAAIKDAEDKQKELDDVLEKYKDEMALEQDIKDQILDNLNTIIENQVENFNFKIKAKLDVHELRKDWNDFRKEMFSEDNFAGRAKLNEGLLGTLIGKNGKGGLVKSLGQHVTSISKELNKMLNGELSDVYSAVDEKTGIVSNDLKAAQEDLKEYLSQLQDAILEAKEAVEDSYAEVKDAIEAAKDAYDTQKDMYDQMSDWLDYDSDYLKAYYGEDFDQSAILNQQRDINSQRIDLAQQERTDWAAKMEEMERKMAATADKSSLQYAKYEELYEEYRQNWINATDELYQAVADQLEKLGEIYENAVNNIIKTFQGDVLGGNSIGFIKDQWDAAQDEADKYFDAVQSNVKLGDLQLGWDKDLKDLNGNVKAQEKLNKAMQEQMDILKEKAKTNKLSQYDIDLAKAKLEITKAQMALDDAAQAKTKMRLRRDSQGNYSYQFVADEDDVESKRQKLLETTAEWYDLVNEKRKDTVDAFLEDVDTIGKELQEKIMAVNQQYEQTMADIDQRLANGTITEKEAEKERKAAAEERDKQINWYQEEARERIQDTLAGLQEVSAEIANNLSNYFPDLTDEQVDQIINKYGDIGNGFINDLLNGDDSKVAMDNFVNNLIEGLNGATGRYFIGMEETIKNTGNSPEDLAKGEDKNVERVDTFTEDNKKLVEQNSKLINNTQKIFDSQLKSFAVFEDQFKKGVSALDKIEAMLEGSYGSGETYDNSYLKEGDSLNTESGKYTNKGTVNQHLNRSSIALAGAESQEAKNNNQFNSALSLYNQFKEMKQIVNMNVSFDNIKDVQMIKDALTDVMTMAAQQVNVKK